MPGQAPAAIAALDSVADQAAELQQTVDDYLFLLAVSIELFQSSPDAIVVVDEAGIIRLVNSQAELLTGYHRSQLRGQPVELLVPDDRKGVHADFGHRGGYMTEPRVRAMGADLDLKLRLKSGAEVAVDINLAPIVTVQEMFIIATMRRRSAYAK